jgi:hypothetical protein
LDPKPPRWNYYDSANRRALFDVYANLLHLRAYPDFISTFTTGAINYNLSDTIKWESVTGSNLQVMVFGNFGVKPKTSTVIFPSTGKWYSYLGTNTLTLASTSFLATLQPGEYYVYTNKDVKALVLPVNWLSFSVQRAGAHSVLLSWSTENEVNNDHYVIERSSDGVSFISIGTVPVSKNISGIQKYSFTDALALNDVNYYRIKQVDRDGNFHYSSVERISLTDIIKHWNIYPNPAKNITGLYALDNFSKAEIVLSDLSGKIIYHTTMTNVAANQQIQIPLQVSKGVYVLKITTEKGTDTEKLVVQ